jgi:hypothetical protein
VTPAEKLKQLREVRENATPDRGAFKAGYLAACHMFIERIEKTKENDMVEEMHGNDEWWNEGRESVRKEILEEE